MTVARLTRAQWRALAEAAAHRLASYGPGDMADYEDETGQPLEVLELAHEAASARGWPNS